MIWLVACIEPVVDRASIVDGPRTLAVSVTPPEAAPGAAITLRTWYIDERGPLDEAPTAFAFCTARLPLAELGPVAPACLEPDAAELSPIGDGLVVEGTVPEDACSQFGPNPPPSLPGEPPGRPVDPDPTGGYYQPALAFDGQVTLAPVRVRCGLAGATQEVSAAYTLGYHDNFAPTPSSLALDPLFVGDQGELVVSWPACPLTPECGDGLCTLGEDRASCVVDCEEPVGCGGAEGYLRYDGPTATLEERREAISASFFASAGTFDRVAVGRGEDEPESSVSTGWWAPDEPGDVWIGVVLRDDRGGVGFLGRRVEVRPR